MKSIDDIRNKNLEILIRENGGDGSARGGVTRLAELMNHNSSAQITQWRKRSPDSKTGKPRIISTGSARKLERVCGKPEGWMDIDNSPNGLTAEDAQFMMVLREDIAQYVVPEHIKQTILTLITNSPKRTGD